MNDDSEGNRFSARAARYARVGMSMSGVAAKFAAGRVAGSANRGADNARALTGALGGLGSNSENSADVIDNS